MTLLSLKRQTGRLRAGMASLVSISSHRIALPSLRKMTSAFAKDRAGAIRGYILDCLVSHRRLRPTASSHAFEYPTVWLLVSLNALEHNELDLAHGWLFGYGGISWRILGLRSSAYLTGSSRDLNVKSKLKDLLETNGYDAGNLLDDTWMLTMPSYFGWEGINPLTVYFCYGPDEKLQLAVLEVHNTFGERHAYILPAGTREDNNPSSGFMHKWTFPRQFHVSPFNNRSGFYTVSITPPLQPPPRDTNTPSLPPLSRRSDGNAPTIRIYYHEANTSGTPGPLKFTATLRTQTARPFTAANVLHTLVRLPLALFLSFARILYHAWILHYRLRLAVHARPDPVSPAAWAGRDASGTGASITSRTQSAGLLWQKEGFFERYARLRAEAFFQQRAEDSGITLTLVAADPTISPRKFFPRGYADADASLKADLKTDPDPGCALTIWYLSPRFFTTLFLTPSLASGILSGSLSPAEQLFTSSSPSLLSSFLGLVDSDTVATTTLDRFAPAYPNVHIPISIPTRAQTLRVSALPPSSLCPGSVSSPPVPLEHPLDPPRTQRLRYGANLTVLWAMLCTAWAEAWVYWAIRTRFVVRGGGLGQQA